MNGRLLSVLVIAYLAVCYADDLSDPAGCKFCHTVTDIIRKDINVSNSTLQAILRTTEKICCAVSPPLICKECQIIVNSTSEIITLITDGLNNTQVCDKLHFCP